MVRLDHMLRDEAEKAVRDIVEEARGAEPGTEARKIGDLYASFMDEERVEQLGATPLAGALALAAAVDSIPSLLAALGTLQRRDVGGLIQPFVNNDPGDPTRYLVFFEQGGIGLPDESYFRDEGFADVRVAYQAHVERMLALAGLDEAAARAHASLTSRPRSRRALGQRGVSRRGQDLQPRELGEGRRPGRAAAGASLSTWSASFGASPAALAEVVVRQPSFVRALGDLLVESRLDAWRDWLAWQVVHGYSPLLSNAFVNENFDFYGRTLTGTEQLRARWKRGVAFVEGAMGEAVGKIYVERHFPPAAKERMDGLVANLIEAYRERSRAWSG